MSPLLSIKDLTISLQKRGRRYEVVHNLSLDIAKGELFALAGESGSGKSLTALSIMGLLPPAMSVTSGSIQFNARDLLQETEQYRRSLRGDRISMIFQDPLTALNPLMPIGTQISENLLFHRQISRKEATEIAAELLQKVGIKDGASRLKSYPHEFSGGMRQRVMIAIAISCSPELLIADEPTTALDVTVQASVMSLLQQLCKSSGSSLLFISHNLALIDRYCDTIAVMYSGSIQEVSPVSQLFSNPLHPYTAALIASTPSIHSSERIEPVDGVPPSIFESLQGCVFYPRCKKRMAKCEKLPPKLKQIENRYVRCHLYE